MWTEATLSAFITWCSPFTWDTSGPDDDIRFHDFVLAAWNEHGCVWDEGVARRIMEREAATLHPDLDPNASDEYIMEKRYEATALLVFLSYVKRTTGRTL